MENELSIFEEIRRGGFQFSVITTYNAFLPFYEEVVLRRLIASGCRHNVVIMDAGECLKNLADQAQRPRCAGFDYTLIPAAAPRAFHPKIILLVGQRKGLLLVGSHNLTLSGFGRNRELSCKIEVENNKDTDGTALASRAFRFINSWLDSQDGRLPDELLEQARRAGNSVSWMKKPTSGNASVRFLGSTVAGNSLWQQLREVIQTPVKSIALIGAFFDAKLEFIRALRDELSPEEFVVGIEPKSVSLPAKARGIEGVRFVDAGYLSSGHGYLHAKAAYMATESGEHFLVSGSANPSLPAWLAPPEARNAEAVTIRSGSDALEAATALGLVSLFKGSALTDEAWNLVASAPSPPQDFDDREHVVLPAVAVEAEDGFAVELAGIDEGIVVSRFLDSNSAVLYEGNDVQTENQVAHLTCPAKLRRAVRFIELHLEDSTSRIAIVHHTYEVRERSQTGKQAQLRVALASLSGDSPDLSGLMKTVEKIIFSEDASVAEEPKRRAEKRATGEDEVEILDSLAVHLDSTKSSRKRRRLMRSGDLGHLLDVLIHHLGYGLERPASNIDQHGRTEEEQVGADDEVSPRLILDGDLVQVCQRKVRTLVTRIGKRLEQAVSDEEKRQGALVQLVAVLAVIRELRGMDHRAQWVGSGETLVPIKEKHRLLNTACSFLFGRNSQLLNATSVELDGEYADEVSRLDGLLMWLAWDCKLSLSYTSHWGETDEELTDKLLDRARLVAIGPRVEADPVATAEAKGSILRFTPPGKMKHASVWLDSSLDLGRRMAERRHLRGGGQGASGPLQPGDIAYTSKDATPRVVLRNTGRQIWLSNLDESETVIKYAAERVTKLL